MRLVVALLAVLLLAAPVLAQTPPAVPAPAVSIVISEDAGTTSLDKAGRFGVTVKNEGAPLPAGNEGTAADVVLSVSGMPAGWTVTIVPASFTLVNGQSRDDIELIVAVAASAKEERADLVVLAELYSPIKGLEPVLGPSGASQKATATDTIQITRNDDVTRDVLETIGPWIYAILLLLVAAVLVAVGLTLSGRRALVRLTSDTREITIPPGGRAVFPFQVEALAKHTDSILLQVSAVQEGWAAFLPTPELALEAGQVQDLTLVVIAPKEIPVGARQAILVTAASAKAPKASANLEFVATISQAAPAKRQAPKGR